MKTELLQLPRDTSKPTEDMLFALRERQELSDQEGGELLAWLRETPFEETPSRAWVGEIAAQLLRAQGGAVKSELWRMCRAAEGWQLYFCLLALAHESVNAIYVEQVRRAASSSEPTIQAFAELSLWVETAPGICDDASSILAFLRSGPKPYWKIRHFLYAVEGSETRSAETNRIIDQLIARGLVALNAKNGEIGLTPCGYSFSDQSTAA